MNAFLVRDEMIDGSGWVVVSYTLWLKTYLEDMHTHTLKVYFERFIA